MNQLRSFLKTDLLTISYELFVEDTNNVITELENFLGVSSHIPIPSVKKESLYKWKKQLTQDEINQIEEVVGFPPNTPA